VIEAILCKGEAFVESSDPVGGKIESNGDAAPELPSPFGRTKENALPEWRITSEDESSLSD